MIKRTGEHVLTWIGVGIGALIVLFVALMVPLMQSDDFVAGMQQSDASLTYEEISQVASGMQVLGTFVLVANVIAVIWHYYVTGFQRFFGLSHLSCYSAENQKQLH